MAKQMKRTTLILAVLTSGLWILYLNFNHGILLSTAITASTFLYHFGMRLVTGTAVNVIMQNHADYNSPWFRQKKWEPQLYKRLHVKNWKKHLPTYDPDAFDSTKHSLDEIARAMCQSEIVHEIIVPLSFLPLLAVKYTGAFPVFLITSLLAAAFDLSFVIIQRYNRPRIIKIINKKNRTQS